MKRIVLFFLLAVISASCVNAQADPAFTSKMIDHVNALKTWYHAGHPENDPTWETVKSTFDAFRLTSSAFSTKLQAMLGDSTEMAKFSNPIGFVNCVANAASWYVQCLNGTSQSHPNAPFCNGGYQLAIVMCATSHL